MASSTRLDVQRFLKSAATYTDAALKKADANNSGYLTAAELGRLPRDLRDNVKAYADAHGRVPVGKFKAAYLAYAKANLTRVDRNKDGLLTPTDIKRLPRDLQDNVKSYVGASRPLWGGGAGGQVKDRTPAARVAEHERAYGRGAVSYKDAVELGKKAVLADREYGPGNILRELGSGDGTPLSESKIQARLEKAFKAMELLPKGESEESYGDPEKDWIFRVDADVGSDHGFWVTVNRSSGDTQVTSFN